MEQGLQIGSVGASIILSILLRMIYGSFVVGNKWKPWVAVFLGMCLAVVALFTVNRVPGYEIIVTYLVQGFMTGATAVGLYEMTKTRV